MKLKTQHSVLFFIKHVALLVVIVGCNNNSSQNSSNHHPVSDNPPDSSKANSHLEFKDLDKNNLNNSNTNPYKNDVESEKSTLVKSTDNNSEVVKDFIQDRALLSAAIENFHKNMISKNSLFEVENGNLKLGADISMNEYFYKSLIVFIHSAYKTSVHHNGALYQGQNRKYFLNPYKGDFTSFNEFPQLVELSYIAGVKNFIYAINNFYNKGLIPYLKKLKENTRLHEEFQNNPDNIPFDSLTFNGVEFECFEDEIDSLEELKESIPKMIQDLSKMSLNDFINNFDLKNE